MSQYEQVRQRTWDLLELTEDPETGDTKWDVVDVLLLLIIAASLAAVVLETVQSIYDRWQPYFVAFDAFVAVVFSVEYVMRVWACTSDARYASPVTGRLRYMVSFYGLTDALAVMPAYLALLTPAAYLDLRFLRALRLFRLLRVLKLGRYSEATDRMKAVFLAKRADLGAALVMVLIVLLVASSVMYHVENTAQPQSFSSIPAAMWWGVSTLTTVGYGDIQPITPLGKLLGALIQILGIAFFALPAGILAAGYEEESSRRRARSGDRCPTCGATKQEGQATGEAA